MTVATAIREGHALLAGSGVPVPRLTAEVLLGHALGQERTYLYGHTGRTLSGGELSAYQEALRQRAGGTPTQYITGSQEFYGREFRVTPDVMIPRPETEFVIEAALELCRDSERMADAGCGSGAIAVTLQLETGADVLATDISPEAIRVASENARRLDANVRFLACDLLSGVAAQSVDLVASNPPYVPQSDGPGLQREVRDFEPHVALFGGADGMRFYRRLVEESPRVLRPGGWLIVEFGIRQSGPLRDMLGPRWRETQVIDDLAGLPRVLATRYCP